MWRLALLVALFCAACTGEIARGVGQCDPAQANSAPLQPAISDPVAGRLDLQLDGFSVAAGAFADVDVDDVHLQSEWEIWRWVRGEAPALRVWTAVVQSPDPLTTVRLDQGTFEGGTLGNRLEPWGDYGVRVRYRDSSAACDDWSSWSSQRTFRMDDGSSYWFDTETIHDIYLEIPAASWSAIDAESVPPGCVPHDREYYRGALVFEGERFEDVGIRVKGGCGSARHLNAKASFKVQLSWDDPTVQSCPEQRRLHGLQRLTLNNLVQDPTYLHERLAYIYYQSMGVPTPRSAHVRVFVNGELWGLYLHLESIDRRFLSRWFDDNDGMLYEGIYWCDLLPENVPPGTTDDYCLRRKFQPDECDDPDPGEDPRDYDLLRQLVAQLDQLPQGEFYPAIEQLIDFDTFLSHWAADAVLGHWDGYAIEIVNNYRIYHDPETGLWTLIPTGLDQSFGTDVDGFAPAGLLAQRCMQEWDCTAAFAVRLIDAAGTFLELLLSEQVQALHERVLPHVAADPRREFSLEEHTLQVQQLRDWIGGRPGRMDEILATHGY